MADLSSNHFPDSSMKATHPLIPMPEPICPEQPWTALAPMQDVTDLPFMKLLGEFGSPDYFFTEYFRVHEHSTLDKHILESITDHHTGRPVFAQLIGEDIEHIRRTVKALAAYPVAGIDLNMGCPAPKVYKKNVGGGLLRDIEKVDTLFEALRDECPGRFTVKMRIGFEDAAPFESILELMDKHSIDLLSIHGRTVKQMYRGHVDYERIKQAKARVRCPVFANGNITSAEKAHEVIQFTGCDGVMIGRSAIRNPWIFRQCREHFSNQPIFRPVLRDVRHYLERLWETTYKPGFLEQSHLNRMKKFTNFIGQGVDEDGQFLKKMRRSQTQQEFFQICDQFLIKNDRAALLYAEEPYEGVVARPNCEDTPETLAHTKGSPAINR